MKQDAGSSQAPARDHPSARGLCQRPTACAILTVLVLLFVTFALTDIQLISKDNGDLQGVVLAKRSLPAWSQHASVNLPAQHAEVHGTGHVVLHSAASSSIPQRPQFQSDQPLQDSLPEAGPQQLLVLGERAPQVLRQTVGTQQQQEQAEQPIQGTLPGLSPEDQNSQQESARQQAQPNEQPSLIVQPEPLTQSVAQVTASPTRPASLQEYLLGRVATPEARNHWLQKPRPQVYIYDLPPEFQKCKIRSEEREGARYEVFNYGAEKRVPDVVRNSSHWTDDAEQADLFYVPAYFYCLLSEQSLDLGNNYYGHQDVTLAVLSYIRGKWPFWDRSGGLDHIWTYTADHGFCGTGGEQGIVDAVVNSIILSHWGLEDREIHCSLKDRMHRYGCPNRKPGADGVPAEQQQPCFVPGKDCVIADTYADDRPLPLPEQLPPENRTTKFFFAGSSRLDDIRYSHGVRQTILALFANQSGFVVIATEQSPELPPDVSNSRSVFCLAATGSGWGVRLKLALTYGCIPVVIADGVQMPYEEVLPYKEFAIRLPQHAIYRLPDILDSLIAEPGELSAMQSRLLCAARFFTWRAQTGLAFEALMCSLRMKILGPNAPHPDVDWATCRLHC